MIQVINGEIKQYSLPKTGIFKECIVDGNTWSPTDYQQGWNMKIQGTNINMARGGKHRIQQCMRAQCLWAELTYRLDLKNKQKSSGE